MTDGHPQSQDDQETSILVTCGRNEGRLYLSKLRIVVNERCRSKCIRTGNTWWTPNEFQFVSGRGAAKDWKRTVKHSGQCLKILLTNGTLCLTSTPPKCLCENCSGTEHTLTSASKENSQGRNENEETPLDCDNGKSVPAAAIDSHVFAGKGVKTFRRGRRNMKGGWSLAGKKTEDSDKIHVPQKRRKMESNSKVELNSDSTVSLEAECIADKVSLTEAGSGFLKDNNAMERQGVTLAVPVVQKRRPGRPKKKKPIVEEYTRAELSNTPGCRKQTDSELYQSKDGNSATTKDTDQKSDDINEDRCSGGVKKNYLSSDFPSQFQVADVEESRAHPSTNSVAKSKDDEPILDGIPTKHSIAKAVEQVTCSKGEEPIVASQKGTSPRFTEAQDDSKAVAQATYRRISSKPEAELKKAEESSAEPGVSLVCVQKIPSGFGDVIMESDNARVPTPSDSTAQQKPDHETDSNQSSRCDAINERASDTEDHKGKVLTGAPSSYDEVTATASVTSAATMPSRKSAYLNAVIAELKSKKISRASTMADTKPPTKLQQTPNSTSCVLPVKLEENSEPQRLRFGSEAFDHSSSPLVSHSLSGKKTSESTSGLHSSTTGNKSSSLKHARPPSAKDSTPLPPYALQSPLQHPPPSLSSSDSRFHAKHSFPKAAADQGVALGALQKDAFWRHLPAMVGSDGGKANSFASGFNGKQTTSGKVDPKASPGVSSALGISQLASMYGLSPSQLASLPFPTSHFPLYPPYLFMGIPLQPLPFQYPSVSAAVPSQIAASAATSVGNSISTTMHSPLHPSSSTTIPTMFQQQQQPHRKRRVQQSTKPSSTRDGRFKDLGGLFGPFSKTMPSLAAAQEAAAAVSRSYAASLHSTTSDVSRQQRSGPNSYGLLPGPWTTSAAHPVKPGGISFNKVASNVSVGALSTTSRDRNLWLPPAFVPNVSSSAREGSPSSRAYEIINLYKSSSAATTKEAGKDGGDPYEEEARGSDLPHAVREYKSDSMLPMDYTHKSRAKEKEKYRSPEEFPCDEQGVLDLSKK